MNGSLARIGTRTLLLAWMSTGVVAQSSVAFGHRDEGPGGDIQALTAQQAYLKASNTGDEDRFGQAVAISGDTLVVGAFNEDSNTAGVNGDGTNNNAPDAGSAYVFVRNGSTWTQQAYLKASNPGSGDEFGSAVGISGDTIVIGSPREDGSATGVNGVQDDGDTNAGAAYVFVRNGSSWTQEAYLKASNTPFAGIFGGAVAISGDTIIVGAHTEISGSTGVNGDQNNSGAGGSGAAYVFVRNGSTWTQEAYLKASNTGESDNFGWAVDVWGDTAVVGAWLEDSSATGIDGDGSTNDADASGAAYIFTRSGTTWSHDAFVKPSNTSVPPFDQAHFGFSVAVWDDTVVVGAEAEHSNATGINGSQGRGLLFSGAAYVFVRTGSTWSQQAYVKASNSGSNDRFGRSVSLSGNLMIIGARLEDSDAVGVNGNQSNNSAQGSGAAYLFEREGTTWAQTAYIKSLNSEGGLNFGDVFGHSVAIDGDTIAVGAFWEDSIATGVNGDGTDNSLFSSGAAYAFQTTDLEVAYDLDVDVSETVTLEPGNHGGDESEDAYATITNVTGSANEAAYAAEGEIMDPRAGGYGVFGVDLSVATSMADGEFFMTISVPITAEGLGGASPFLVDLAYFNTATEMWELATSGNTLNSPGHGTPEGDRFVAQDVIVPDPAYPSADLGDYGVFWNTATQQGYVWANVDHTTEFAAGIAGMIQYGCGTNPEQSLAPLDGPPVLGGLVTVGVDDPLGSSPGGSVAMLLVSIAPDPTYPCGTPLPGYGMAGPTGELLVSVLPPNPVVLLGPVVWSGPGTPAEIDMPIPNDVSLLGLELYTQAIMANVGSVKFSDGLQIAIGS